MAIKIIKFCFIRSDFKDVPYIGYYKFLQPAIVLRDPDLIKDVLIKDCSSFHANDIHLDKKHDPLLATNPFLTTDEDWKRGRSILVPIFSANKVIVIIACLQHNITRSNNYSICIQD